MTREEIYKIKTCDVVLKQQERMEQYRKLINIASCKEEVDSLYKAYEISRLIHIKHEDIIERSSWLLKGVENE
jgi:hypothetical protein